jgi:hypothetical protein
MDFRGGSFKKQSTSYIAQLLKVSNISKKIGYTLWQIENNILVNRIGLCYIMKYQYDDKNKYQNRHILT